MKIYFRGPDHKLIPWSKTKDYKFKDEAVAAATALIKRNKVYLEKDDYRITHPIVVIK